MPNLETVTWANILIGKLSLTRMIVLAAQNVPRKVADKKKPSLVSRMVLVVVSGS